MVTTTVFTFEWQPLFCYKFLKLLANTGINQDSVFFKLHVLLVFIANLQKNIYIKIKNCHTQ